MLQTFVALEMQRGRAIVVAIIVLGLAVFILFVPVVPYSWGCESPPSISCPRQTQYESISFHFFGVGGFYYQPCGYLWEWSGNFECWVPTGPVG